MMVTVKYFALLRESVGMDEEKIELSDTVKTVGDLRAFLSEKDEVHRQAFANIKRIRAAVNACMSPDTTQLSEHDEVAFFPPVTGG